MPLQKVGSKRLINLAPRAGWLEPAVFIKHQYNSTLHLRYRKLCSDMRAECVESPVPKICQTFETVAPTWASRVSPVWGCAFALMTGDEKVTTNPCALLVKPKPGLTVSVAAAYTANASACASTMSLTTLPMLANIHARAAWRSSPSSGLPEASRK